MNVSDEPAASIYGADNFIATHPYFVEGNLLFALICVYPYVSVCAPLKFIYGPMMSPSVLSLWVFFSCVPLSSSITTLLVSTLGVIIALNFCVPSHADAYAMQLKDGYCVLEEHIPFSKLHGLKSWKTVIFSFLFTDSHPLMQQVV